MRAFLTTIAATVLLTACGETTSKTDTETNAPTTTSTSGYDIARQYEKFAEVPMNPDVSFLTNTERKVVNKLIEASDYISKIYLLQRGADYPQRRYEIQQKAVKGDLDAVTQLAMFDLHFGPCDTLEDDNRVFVGNTVSYTHLTLPTTPYV